MKQLDVLPCSSAAVSIRSRAKVKFKAAVKVKVTMKTREKPAEFVLDFFLTIRLARVNVLLDVGC